MPSLADLIAVEADAVSAFVLLLQREQEALKKGEADALPEIIEQKNVAIAKITPISGARNTYLERFGLVADRAGIEKWLENNPKDTQTRASWLKLQAKAAEARELNRLNGELIRLRMSHNTRLLESLLASNRQGLYGANGQTSSAPPTSRIIDSA